MGEPSGLTRNASANWRDGLFAVSIANLAMINVWRLLLYVSERDHYYLRTLDAGHYGSAALLLTLLSVIVWLAVKLVRRLDHPVATFAGQTCVLLLLINVFEYLRESLGFTRLEIVGIIGGLPLYAHLLLFTTLLAILPVAIAHRRAISRAASVALLIISPLAFSNILQAAWRGSQTPPRVAPTPVRTSDTPAADTETRVVWIVFDEFDYRLGFPDRPDFIDLPELDRLREESFSATRALEPAAHTGTSIPSFLLGRPVIDAEPISANRFELHLERPTSSTNDVPSDFQEQETFFHRVHERGLRLGIVGIYHPYCRLFEATYASCHWDPFLPGGGIANLDSFAGILATHAYKLVPVFSYRGEHIASIKRSIELGAAAAADPQLDAIFLHLPLPHSPYVYDQKRETMTVLKFGPNAYYEQMALADRSFGEIRRAMETAGTWEQSIVLVTSDHGWRFAGAHGTRRDHRVPFILKLPGKSTAAVYDRAFRAWEANAILLAALSGELSDATAIATWLDERWPAELAAPITR